MPARKNRPHKHGTSGEAAASAKKRQVENNQAERGLVDKFIEWERDHPRHDHYVGWPDMAAAERLVKKGYLIEGTRATGCFHVTETFRQTFMST